MQKYYCTIDLVNNKDCSSNQQSYTLKPKIKTGFYRHFRIQSCRLLWLTGNYAFIIHWAQWPQYFMKQKMTHKTRRFLLKMFLTLNLEPLAGCFKTGKCIEFKSGISAIQNDSGSACGPVRFMPSPGELETNNTCVSRYK